MLLCDDLNALEPGPQLYWGDALCCGPKRLLSRATLNHFKSESLPGCMAATSFWNTRKPCAASETIKHLGYRENHAFSHVLCVSPPPTRKNTIFPRGISQGYQGVSKGIKGYQLPVYMGLWGISPPARFLRAYEKPRFQGYQIG